MSNILIIKHGSLGDIVQISGILRDIREAHKSESIFILTTLPYVDLLSRCPFIDGVLIDYRNSRWNILYMIKLKKSVEKYKFTKVYDLQNSSRTSFYRKYLFNIKNWSSTETTLPKDTKKKDFDKEPVLKRFEQQLKNSNVKVQHTIKPDFSWSIISIKKIINKYFGNKYILVLPFSSSKNLNKRWPYYNELIKIIKTKHKDLNIVLAPGVNEIEEGKKINAISILNNNKSLSIMEMAGLINEASYVIGNDTGPAHIAAHLGKRGVVIFGTHTTPEKVSIETKNFKVILTKDLSKLSAEDVYAKIKEQIELIN